MSKSWCRKAHQYPSGQAIAIIGTAAGAQKQPPASTSAPAESVPPEDAQKPAEDARLITPVSVPTEAKQTIPHFYVTSEVDMTDVLVMRQTLNASAGEGGVKWQLLVIASTSTRFSGSFHKQRCKVSMNMLAELPEMKR